MKSDQRTDSLISGVRQLSAKSGLKLRSPIHVSGTIDLIAPMSQEIPHFVS